MNISSSTHELGCYGGSHNVRQVWCDKGHPTLDVFVDGQLGIVQKMALQRVSSLSEPSSHLNECVYHFTSFEDFVQFLLLDLVPRKKNSLK